MKIDPFRNRTLSSPLAGVTFDRADEARINAMSQILMALPDSALLVMRDGLAREILYLSDLGDWTSGEAEEIRFGRLQNAFLTYQATYATHAYARTLKRGEDKS